MSQSVDERAADLALALIEGRGDRLDGVAALGNMLARARLYDAGRMGDLVAVADELDAIPRTAQQSLWEPAAYERERARGKAIIDDCCVELDEALRAVVDAHAAQRDQTVILYRPVGPEELALVEASGFTSWPPRLREQPIFYPVTNEAYATRIAREWNVADSGFGAVTRFEVRNAFMDEYETHQVGGSEHVEWWIPSEDLDELNRNIVGCIEVIAEFGKRR